MNPTMNAIGFGAAGKFSATWAHAGAGGRSSVRYVTFPAEGFYPQQLLEKHHVWSFSPRPQKAAKRSDNPLQIPPRPDGPGFRPK
jgi:hypothetical protein